MLQKIYLYQIQKRRGSLSSELKVNATQINNLGRNLVSTKNGDIQIVAKSIENTQSADKVSISIELKYIDKVIEKDKQ